MNRCRPFLVFFLLLLALGGCSRWKSSHWFSRETQPEVLRVGIAADSPPLVFKKNGAISGLEPNFAAGLARSMSRKAELIEMPRATLAQALVAKKIDIIMAGVTTAYAQEQGLAASTPYLVSGQISLVHLNDFKQLGSGSANLKKHTIRLGTVAGSAGDRFVASLQPQGKTTRFATPQDGVQALNSNAIDAFIYDMPANLYYASLYIDKGLTPGIRLMTREELAWAVRPDDKETMKAANDYLDAVQNDGTLHKLIEQSIPFYRDTAYSPLK